MTKAPTSKTPGALATPALIGRIGGLAVALGIGGAVATGLAAQAAAAPAGSSTPDSAISSVGRDASAAPSAARPHAAHRAKGSAPTAPARRSAVHPAAAVAVAPRVALRPVPAAAAPGRRAAPVPTSTVTSVTNLASAVTVTPTAATAQADIWSSLMTRLAGIFGWDARGRLQTIYQGTHFTIPNNFGFFIQKVSGSATFTANTTYDLGDVDQYDWNKLTGIAFTPLEPDRDSAMVGWRYNLVTQMFEIAPFYNVNKIRILPNENPLSPGYEVISVPADQTFTYTVDYTGVTISYGDRTVTKPYPTGLTPNVWTAARVSGWFGGNEVAPRTVSYYLKLD